MKNPAETMKKILGVLFLTGLAIGTSCVLKSPTGPSERPTGRSPRDAVCVFFTGNELGALKPCGCSGGQLGGLDRRSAVFNAVAEPQRLIVDIGSLVDGDGEQDLIKFNIIVQAYDLLGYDVVSLSEKDIEIGGNLGLLEGLGSAFGIISGRRPAGADLPAKFAKNLALDGGPVAVTVAAFDAKSAAIEQVAELFPPPPGRRAVGILILNHCDAGIIDFIARRVSQVHCIVCPSESEEPMVIGEADGGPLVFSVGRYGRYVCELQIRAGRTGPKLSFRPIKVSEDLPQDIALVRLYEDYQLMVKERNLLEKYPRFVLPGGVKYSGSQSCNTCHDYEYEKWSGNAHADAFATLERAGSQYDPECVVCHVVGMKYQSGYISEQKTLHLKNVGCEICHGPGSEHVRTMGATELAGPTSTCLDCHTSDHSSDYAGNEQQKLEKIKHWREPNAAGNVK